MKTRRTQAGVTCVGVFVAITAVACAPRASSTPFVKKAPGMIDLGRSRDQQPALTRDAIDQAIRTAQAARASGRPEAPPEIEQRDPLLKAALAAVKAGETVRGHVVVAEQYLRVGVRDMAYEHFSRALTLDPKALAALDGRARLLRDVGLMSMALGDAHRARYHAPDSAIARNTLGTILEKLGQCREATAAYREAARLSEGAAWAEQNVTRVAASCPG